MLGVKQRRPLGIGTDAAGTRRVKSRPDPTTPAGDRAAMGALLYRKRNVVVSSKQQVRNTAPTLPIRRIAFKMKAYSWAASKFTWCPRVPICKNRVSTPVGLQRLRSWLAGYRKCLKRFGGPGEIR